MIRNNEKYLLFRWLSKGNGLTLHIQETKTR